MVPWSIQQHEVTWASICWWSFLMGAISRIIIYLLVRRRINRSLKPRMNACISYFIRPRLSPLSDLSFVLKKVPWKRLGNFILFWRKKGKNIDLQEWRTLRSCREQSRNERFVFIQHIYIYWNLPDNFHECVALHHVVIFGPLILSGMVFWIWTVHAHMNNLNIKGSYILVD